MKLRALSITTILAIGSVPSSAYPQSLFGPKGRFDAGLLNDLAWKADRACSKPMLWGSGKEEREAFVQAMIQWTECVNSAAKADAEWAIEKINADRQKQIDEGISEAKRKLELGY